MFLEMQISASKLGAILRQRVDPRALSVDVEFPWQAATWVVDRIVLTDDTSVDRATTTTPKSVWGSGTDFWVDAPRMQVIQPLQIHLVERATMLANGPKESAPTHVFTIRLVFNLDMAPRSFASGVPAPVALTTSLDHIDWLLLGRDVTLQLRSSCKRSSN